MQAISNSEMNLWARCPRSWFITYYLGMVPAAESPVGARQTGTRVHTAMEGLYGYGLDPILVLKLLYAAEINEHPEFEGELRKEWDLANAMVEGYQEWVISEGKDADLAVIATEQDVRVPLPMAGEFAGQVELRGKLDVAVQEVSTGFLYFIDWKTSGNFDQHQILELNTQFKLYSLMLHLAHGQPLDGPLPPGSPVVNGGIIRTLRRCKRTERSKPPYFMHDPFRYNPEQLRATLARAQRLCTQIMTARRDLDWCYSPAGGNGDLAMVNGYQRFGLAPNPIPGDCSWRCSAAHGLCVSMDDGADWTGMLTRSGRWKQADPYAHYERAGFDSIRAQLAAL
jgi:PD-(D/E)XK nuclease superfamily